MTNREFFNAVIAETTNAEIASHAVAELEKLDARNARRSARPSKTQIANEPLIKAIAEILTSEPQTASEIATKVEISVNKASALLRQIDGLTVTEVKVKGKGKVKGYALT